MIKRKKEFLKARGWFPWYHTDYWCHKQFGNKERDCTNLGMSLDKAYEFELQKIGFKPVSKSQKIERLRRLCRFA